MSINNVLFVIGAIIVFFVCGFNFIEMQKRYDKLKKENAKLKEKIIEKNIMLIAAFKQMSFEQKANMEFCCEKCKGSGKIENQNCTACDGIGILPEITKEVLEVIKNDF